MGFERFMWLGPRAYFSRRGQSHRAGMRPTSVRGLPKRSMPARRLVCFSFRHNHYTIVPLPSSTTGWPLLGCKNPSLSFDCPVSGLRVSRRGFRYENETDEAVRPSQKRRQQKSITLRSFRVCVWVRSPLFLDRVHCSSLFELCKYLCCVA